jgi:dTDP-glucose pyrophosphorylase
MMTILIPMAGEGSRFVKEGYSNPKPVIPVDDYPMVVRATQSFPKAEEYVFVCRDFHISEHGIDKTIQEFFPDAKILSLDHLTEGQASTCLLAKQHLNLSEELIIGACDNAMIYDHVAFQTARKEADVLAFTFRNNVTVLEKPNQYGWLKVDDNNNIIGTSIKSAISSTPMNDHAVVGAFWFRKAEIFTQATERMIAQNRRVNGEFYVDEVMRDCYELGYKTKVFEIENYICWGTPNDYKTYNYWNEYFNKIKL